MWTTKNMSKPLYQINYRVNGSNAQRDKGRGNVPWINRCALVSWMQCGASFYSSNTFGRKKSYSCSNAVWYPGCWVLGVLGVSGSPRGVVWADGFLSPLLVQEGPSTLVKTSTFVSEPFSFGTQECVPMENSFSLVHEFACTVKNIGTLLSVWYTFWLRSLYMIPRDRRATSSTQHSQHFPSTYC